MASKLVKTKHTHLFQDTGSGYYYYRRYSSLKKRQYFRSTGERSNAARAYRVGLEAFNKWLGKVEDEKGEIYFDRYAESFLERKIENHSLRARTKTLAEYDVKHLVDAFGHLRLEQITPHRYEEWVKDSRRAGRRKNFFTARKTLVQILRNAHADGHIARVPRLPALDAPPAPPQYIPRHTVRRLLKHCPSANLKLLAFIMWKQGARPGEVLQYEWSMIRWDEDNRGWLHIPGRITKTRRARTIPLNSRVDRILRKLHRARKGAFLFPGDRDHDRPYEQYSKGWASACAAAGAAYVSLYTLRDTFVTDRLRAGKSLAFIAQYVDSSPKQLADRYAVAEEEAMRGVAG